MNISEYSVDFQSWRIVVLLMIIGSVNVNSFGQKELKWEKLINKDDITILKHDTAYVFKTCEKKLRHVNRKKNYYYLNHRELGVRQGAYMGKLIDGEYMQYKGLTGLIEKGEFHKGVKNGTWITWYNTGSIRSVTKWHKGKPVGKRVEYSEVGDQLKVQRWKHRSWVDIKDKSIREKEILLKKEAKQSKKDKNKDERDKKKTDQKDKIDKKANNELKVTNKEHVTKEEKRKWFNLFGFLKKDKKDVKEKKKSTSKKKGKDQKKSKKIKLDIKKNKDGKKN